ncbi:efflux RND transporter permease subunit [Leeuwenhoekiella palythoae]|mgnify:FL=1|uniref:Multidrug efflux pump subunit AcrB n=1 Tax=Leeuwenhoekiella palythoae TaxID=573501 RepID=A0A1M5YP62_9FLAO|nr:efflux RND transporter permease subunit [Leeuwenhoekiella palythoae]MBH11413.1 AcrB/AcrD/AcrF family protein [Leeuwenhoekiella sp.]RXG29361.1 multidrug efflux pump subunit AcrB [Leeuwenhoekiella palythoae]UBZ11599.1 efflux RND transporter permease subunit [Leeuwenhoekiella palythoae]SHI13680.1 Multidrug efflux pump subunit AcrB [Leeuwenhoekiella palythoae]HAX14028.1 AcrB/AcrD/AcrF family protein [Leeuwenhoekiella sp.]
MAKNTYKEFSISSWAIDNKMTVYVITAIILLSGLAAYYSMPREAFPEIIETKIYVSSVNPGNAAEDVEKFITEPLEEEFNDIAGIKEITSTTLQDYSIIIVEFEEDVDVNVAKTKVKDKVDLVKAETTWPTLDNGAKVEPNIFDLNISEEQPILNINLTGDFQVQQLKDYAEYLQDKIELLPQIKEATVRGAEEQEVEVAVDIYKMTASKVSFDNIINAIRSENNTISAGNVISDGLRKNIRVLGEIQDPKELNNIVVKRDGGNIFLKDIATVRFKEKDATTYAREYGQPVVMLDVKKRAGKNMIEAVESIKKIVAEEEANYYPESLHISLTNDQSIKTENQVDDLVNNIIFGVILVVVVLMFFLGFRNALFVGFAIPLSMFMSLTILSSLGFTLNTMVLFGLVMGLGMLVDNGIVVVENVYSLMDQGMPRLKAAKQGLGEIAWPIIASTATTLAAFFPLGLWPGTIGKFMIYFPITLSVVLSSSLFVALIINSMLTSRFMKTEEEDMSKKSLVRNSLILTAVGAIFLIVGFVIDSGGFRGIGNLLLLIAILLWAYKYFLAGAVRYFQFESLRKLENFYERFLKYALRGRKAYVFFFGTVIMLFLSFVLVGIAQPNVLFFPENEPNQIITYIEYPEGTAIEKTNQLTKQIEERIFDAIKKYEDADGYNYMVESAISQVGQGAGNPQTDGGQSNEMPHKGKVTLSMRDFKLRRGVSSSTVLSEVRDAVKGFPGASVIVEKDANGPPVGYPINIEISGEDYEEMLLAAENMRTYIEDLGIGGIEELKLDVNKSKAELGVTVSREKAGQLGISTAQVGQTLRRSVYGEEASTYKEGDDDYEINVRFNEDYRYDENALFNQPVTFRNNQGQIIQVPISALVDKKSSAAFSAIKRKDLKRVITLYSNVLTEQGFNATQIVEQLKQDLAGYETPNGIEYSFTGEQEEQADNMSFLLMALGIAMGSILLILVAQFNSLSKPVIILMAVVLSLVGVFLGLIIFQMDFVILMTMMGIISLAGIVVNNAIVLIDYTQILIDRKKEELGIEDDEYLTREEYFRITVAGGKSRLRPVLLTAITTVLGLIPLAVGLNIDFFGLFTDYDAGIYIGGDNVIFWGPLAWTVIFGLVFATFLTLVIVPVMFYLTNRAKVKFSEKRKVREEQKQQAKLAAASEDSES